MKIHSLLLVSLLWALVPSVTMAITNVQLGKLLLEEKYSQVNQEYNVYYAQGPTSATTVGGYHPGVDYRASAGTLVYSPVSGKVSSTSTTNGRVSVKIEGTTLYFIFLHLDSFNVSAGSMVKVGDTIGAAGSRGATSAHLHVEVRDGNELAAYYFKKSTETGTSKNPGASVTITDHVKLTYVYNRIEKQSVSFAPSTRMSTSLQSNGGGYRTYFNGNQMFTMNTFVMYYIGGKTSSSNSTVANWYTSLGGP
jgi:murein DD-endopeptidase MepM/ murein hydrolase activator NlpD